MIRIERSVTINLPVEEVFNFVTNIDNLPKWFPALIEAEKTSPGPIGVGTTEHEVFRFYRFIKGENTGIVTEYQPNKKIAWKTTSPHFPKWYSTYNFESVEGGTNITYTIEWEARGLYKLFNPFIVFMATKFDVEKPLRKLKIVMESQNDQNN